MNEEELYRIMHTCAWCGKEIPEDSEIFSVPGRARVGIDLRSHEGSTIPISLRWPGKTVYALVVGHDSQAKREGYDFVFVACSAGCAESLREALKKEIDIRIH